MYYLEISVITKEPQITVNSNIIETCIMKCLKQFVGEEGCKDKFEILKYDDSERKIILRCSNESYIRLRASLVISNNCEEHSPFSFVINRATENLLSLRCNSRTFKHDECQNKYGNANAWKYCCRVFDLLTIAALIDEQVLCVHGGLSPLIRTLDQIRTIERNQEIPHRGAFCDLVWSDPDDVDTWTVSPRGAGWLFGSKATHMFTEINDLKLICRAHQLVQEGYRYMFNDKLITVWSAPNYCYRCGNIASILQFTTVDDRKPVLFQAVPDSERVIPPIITTPYFL